MSDQPRPVWLTKKQRDDLTYIVNHLAMHDYPDTPPWDLTDALGDRRAADPVEAIVEWFNANFAGADESRDSVLNGAYEILSALGWEKPE